MAQKIVRRLLMTGFVAFFSSLSLMAQHKVEMVPFGEMGRPSNKGVEHYWRKYKECICDRADHCNQGRSGL